MNRLIATLAEDFENFAPEMVASPKASAYRIYRDTRFSKNKTPYKTHVAAVFPRQGLGKHEGAGFYLHVGCDEVLIGGGLYMPLPEDLAALRSHISDNWGQLRSIVKSRSFRRLLGDITGEQLVRVPRGYAADHPGGDYLRMKQFLAGRSLEPEVAGTPEFYALAVETFRTMLPLIRFLNEPIVRRHRIRERQDAMLR